MTGSDLKTVNKIRQSPVTDKSTEIRQVWDEGRLAGEGWSHRSMWPDTGSEDTVEMEGRAGASEEFPSEGGRLSPLSALSHTAVSLVQGRAAAKAGPESQQKGEHVRVPAAEFPPLPGKWVSADPLYSVNTLIFCNSYSLSTFCV